MAMDGKSRPEASNVRGAGVRWGRCEKWVKRVETRSGACTWRTWGQRSLVRGKSRGQQLLQRRRRRRRDGRCESDERRAYPLASMDRCPDGTSPATHASNTNRISPSLRTVVAHLPFCSERLRVCGSLATAGPLSPPVFPPARLLRARSLRRQPLRGRETHFFPGTTAGPLCGRGACLLPLCCALLGWPLS